MAQRRPRHMAAPGPRPERRADPGPGTDPGSTMMFVAALEASRKTQATAPTPDPRAERADRSRRIASGVPDPLEADAFIPAAPSAPAASPFLPQPHRPKGPGHLRRTAPAPDTTAAFMEALEEGGLHGRACRRHGLAPGDTGSVDLTRDADVLAGEPPLVGVEPGEVLPVASFDDDPLAAEAGEARAAARADVEASVGRSAAMMSLLVILSRITGFLRTWGQGAAIGGAMLASCYTVANNLPNQLYELVMGGMLVTAFLPVYLSVKEEGGRERASAYTSNLVTIVLVVMAAVALLGFVFASQVVLTQSFGATEDFDHGLAIYFFRFFVVEVVLYGLSSVFSGVLNAERDYFWSTAAPVFNNIICTASFAAYALLVGTEPAAAVLALAVGNPLGVAVQVLMQMPSLRRHGIRLRLSVDLHDPALRETLSIGVPSLVVMVVSFATVSVQTSCVLSATSSGAAVAYYARLWYTLPYAILAVPVTTAMFTELSHAYAARDIPGFVSGISSGCSRILFFLVPMAVLLVVFSPQLSQLLNAGSFTAEETSMIAGYLSALAVSLPFYGVCTYLQKVCSSWRRMRLFAVANVVAGVVQVVFCLALTPVWGYVVPGLSSLFFFVAVDVVTFVQLRRELGPIGFKALLACAVRSLALGLAGGAAGAHLVWALTGPAGLGGPGLAKGLLVCVAAGLPALAVTFGGAMALRLPEASFLRSMVGRVASRRAA